jgi:hypothetical protein
MHGTEFMRGILTAALFLGMTGVASAGAGLGIKVGSLGIGAELTKSLTKKVNVRVGGNLFNYSYSGTEDDIEYDFELKLKNFQGLIDLHPSGGAFRLSGGLVSNSNVLDAKGLATGNYDIGNGTYTSSEVGTLTAKVDFKRAVPYAGIGFGNAGSEGKGVGFIFDLGVVFQGAPNAALTANGSASGRAQFQSDLRLEEANLQEDLKVFKYYPVIAIGISFKF